jgi:hypothetical protein
MMVIARSTAPQRRCRCPGLVRLVLLGLVAALPAACDTPVGVSPALKGTYWENALVTNPNGGGPMVVRWGPPDPWVPDRD